MTPIGTAIGLLMFGISEAFIAGSLAFAAGAMIFVVIEELIPESQLDKNTDVSTVGAMLGFAVMMTLDVSLG
jgi:ZIP family zinc transporter